MSTDLNYTPMPVSDSERAIILELRELREKGMISDLPEEVHGYIVPRAILLIDQLGQSYFRAGMMMNQFATEE